MTDKRKRPRRSEDKNINSCEHNNADRVESLVDFVEKYVAEKMRGRVPFYSIVIDEGNEETVKSKIEIEIEMQNTFENFDRLADLVPFCKYFSAPLVGPDSRK